MVTSSDGTPFTVTSYQWDTRECFTSDRHPDPTCFPTDQTTQVVTGNTSGLLTLRISGIRSFYEVIIVNNCKHFSILEGHKHTLLVI